MSTVASVSATRAMRSRTRSSAGLSPSNRGAIAALCSFVARTQALHLAAQGVEPERAIDDEREVVDLERLGDEVVRAGADRRDRGLERAERRHDDDRQIFVARANVSAELDAAHAAHVDVGDDDVEVVFAEEAQAILCGVRAARLVSARFEIVRNEVTKTGVVVDEENVGLHLFTPKVAARVCTVCATVPVAREMTVSSDDFDDRMAALGRVPRRGGTPRRHTRRARRVLALYVVRIEGDDLVGALCHDLKDPLAAITMGTALLRKQLPNERAVDSLANATRRLDRVVQNARDLDLLRKGAFAPQLRPLPVASVILPNIERMRDAATARKITIVFEPAEMRGSRRSERDVARVRGAARQRDRFRARGDDRTRSARPKTPHTCASTSTMKARASMTRTCRSCSTKSKNRSHRPRRGAGRGLPLARAYAQAQSGDVEISTRSPNGCRAALLSPLQLSHYRLRILIIDVFNRHITSPGFSSCFLSYKNTFT